MKEVTKEQIDNAVDKISDEVSENIVNALIENIKVFEKIASKNKEDGNIMPYALYISTMHTAVQASTLILKETLYELLSED